MLFFCVFFRTFHTFLLCIFISYVSYLSYIPRQLICFFFDYFLSSYLPPVLLPLITCFFFVRS